MHISLQLIFTKVLFVLVESTMQPFVVEGDYSKITSFPHSAHLGVNCKSNIPETTGLWVCGASILTQEAGLTAGHCLYSCNNFSKVTISTGNIKPMKGAVTIGHSFVVHFDFQTTTIGAVYDIALVRFWKPLKFSFQIKRVALMEKFLLPKEAYVAGWGLIQVSNFMYYISSKLMLYHLYFV